MRILHIMSGYGGGISTFIKNKAEVMPQHQVTFDVVTYDECDMEFVQTIQETGGDVYRLLNPKKHGWKAFQESLTNVLKRYTYDIVYCHISGYRAYPYYWLCKQYGKVKFYVHAHLERKQTLSHRINQWVNRKLSSAYVGCSVTAIQSEFGKEIPIEQMVVIPNSIDEQRYVFREDEQETLRQQYREKYHLDEKEICVAHVARLDAIKNHAFTLQLAQLAKQKEQSIKWFIIGSGALEQEIRQQIAQLNLEDCVIMTGRMNRIHEVYAMMDVLVLPSFYEGFATVLAEAQAADVHALASNTLPHEVDLHIDLLDYLPLSDLSIWLDKILLAKQQKKIPRMQRLLALERSKLTNASSGALYVDFLNGRVTHYLIGESRAT